MYWPRRETSHKRPQMMRRCAALARLHSRHWRKCHDHVRFGWDSRVTESPLQTLRRVLPGADIDTRDAMILTWLVIHARAETGLCWPSAQNLARYVKCSRNAIIPAFGRLAGLGHLSFLARLKQATIVFVHIGGRGQFEPLREAVVHHHLAEAKFKTRDADAVLGWLRSIAAFEASCTTTVHDNDPQRCTAVVHDASNGHALHECKAIHCSSASACSTAVHKRQYNSNRIKKVTDRAANQFAETVVPIPIDRPDPADVRRLIEDTFPRADAARREVK